MRYEAPLRCESCGTVIYKKPKSKTPKYCASCRQTKQEMWREQIKKNRQRRVFK